MKCVSRFVAPAVVLVPAVVVASRGLEGWWRFTEAGGALSEDASGCGRAVIVDTNCVWRVRDAPGGGALWFDGMSEGGLPAVDAFAGAPGFSEAKIDGGFTVSAWVFVESPVPYAPIVVRTGDVEAWNDGFGLFLGTGGEFSAFVRSGDDANAVSGGVVATGRWCHVAAVYTGTSLSLFMDGVSAAERSFPAFAPSDAPAPLMLGTLQGDGAPQDFCGALADVRIWSRALSGAEVGAVYRQFLADAVEADSDDDGDGMPNGWEVGFGLNPRDPRDADADSDGDGVSNRRECALGRSPRARAEVARPSLIRSATATGM